MLSSDRRRDGESVILYTHPSNLEEVKKVAQGMERRDPTGFLDMVFGVEVRTSPWLPKSRKTGKYVLPDGSVVDAEDVRVDGRFVEYGPEDLEVLLFFGIVTEHEELLFWNHDPNIWKPVTAIGPGVSNPRWLIKYWQT